jgi:hypothetical protein
MSDGVHDQIATVLEKLHAVEPELTAELVKLLSGADLAGLFGGKPAFVEASSPPAPLPPSPPAPSPSTVTPDDLAVPRSPDRFPNWPGKRGAGETAWSA